jgi:hypothetical protein
MAIERRRIPVIPAAFAGALIFPCTFLHPASAATLAPPIARALEATRCATLSPRFEPPASRGPTPDAISYRFPGGAKLRSLVGEPCPTGSTPREV